MKNWEKRTLDEVCELITCGVAARPNYVNEGVPFLSAKNVKAGQIVWSGYNCISEQTHKELTKNNKPCVGDILYTRVGSYGEAAVIEDDFEFSVFVSLTLIKVDKNVLNNYFLKHYLNSDFIKRLAKKSISGSGVGNLNVGTVREFPIPLPPLPEQKRIVAILDQAFAAIDQAKANTEKSLQNAKDLFESYLQNVFDNPGEDWKDKELQDVAKIISGYSFDSKDFSSTNKVKSVKITNVGVKEFIEENSNYLPEKYKTTLKDFQVKEGNIVLALTRTIIAAGLKVSVVPKSYDGALLNQRVAALIPQSKIMDQNYLFYFLCTNKVAKYVIANVNTLMQPNLSISDLKRLPIPCPTLLEQKGIVKNLNSLVAETKKLEGLYQIKIEGLNDLKKSILQKAFSGELTYSIEKATA